MQKRAQVTLFIILAVVIIAAALITFFVIRGLPQQGIPAKILPVENYLRDCIDTNVKDAAKIAALQGGYIDAPEFEPGSEYMPFSNQLNFIGMSVPYWFYVSGNNIAQVQKPSMNLIQEQMAAYLKDKIKECDFSGLREQGYDINFSGEPDVDVSIKSNSIDTNIKWAMSVGFGSEKTTINEHKVSSKSSLGSLYLTASDIFNAEQEQLFLENYSTDVLRLYAPVDGVELSCVPKIWVKKNVSQDIKQGLEGNIQMIKMSGSYYSIANSDNRYFIVDSGKKFDDRVSFLYSNKWPTRLEIWPEDNGIMRADPVGIQEGLGILGAIGFCYVPYHFVYDLYYPVLIQVSHGDEIFQFPVIVAIDKMQTRSVNVSTEPGIETYDICQHKTQQATVFSYDDDSKALEAEIYYKCFNQVCDLGKTSMSGSKTNLVTSVPQCYNGYLIARAPGYKDKKMMIESNGPFVANIFLSISHPLSIEMPSLRSDENAIITFASGDNTITAYYPEQKEISLAEGNYNVSVYVFKQSLITLQSQKAEQCIKVPAGGIAGMFGAMQEQCYELDVPQESLTNVLFGGGISQVSFTESDLKHARSISIATQTFNVPKNLIELSDAYTLLGSSDLSIILK